MRRTWNFSKIPIDNLILFSYIRIISSQHPYLHLDFWPLLSPAILSLHYQIPFFFSRKTIFFFSFILFHSFIFQEWQDQLQPSLSHLSRLSRLSHLSRLSLSLRLYIRRIQKRRQRIILVLVLVLNGLLLLLFLNQLDCH